MIGLRFQEDHSPGEGRLRARERGGVNHSPLSRGDGGTEGGGGEYAKPGDVRGLVSKGNN